MFQTFFDALLSFDEKFMKKNEKSPYNNLFDLCRFDIYRLGFYVEKISKSLFQWFLWNYTICNIACLCDPNI